MEIMVYALHMMLNDSSLAGCLWPMNTLHGVIWRLCVYLCLFIRLCLLAMQGRGHHKIKVTLHAHITTSSHLTNCCSHPHSDEQALQSVFINAPAGHGLAVLANVG